MSDSEKSGPALTPEEWRQHDDRLVEFIGGPNDGEFRPANENGLRPGGMYVVQSTSVGTPLAMIFVPVEDLRWLGISDSRWM